MWYFIDYNGAYIAMYKRLCNALKFIERKGLKNDSLNSLWLVDSNGDTYNPVTGVKHK
jgi:hypothetical protein